MTGENKFYMLAPTNERNPMPDLCDNCNGRFDVSLPDMDDHSYECERCEAEVCFDCKNMDTGGMDFCDQCADDMEEENPDAFKH